MIMERRYVVICNRHRGIAGGLLFWGRHTEDNDKRSLEDIQVILMAVKNTRLKR